MTKKITTSAAVGIAVVAGVLALTSGAAAGPTLKTHAPTTATETTVAPTTTTTTSPPAPEPAPLLKVVAPPAPTPVVTSTPPAPAIGAPAGSRYGSSGTPAYPYYTWSNQASTPAPTDICPADLAAIEVYCTNYDGQGDPS